MRHPVAAVRQSAVVLAVVAAAAGAHGIALAAQRAINLDGSQSSLVPASPQQVALDLTVYWTASAALVATYTALLLLAMRGRIRGLGRVVVLAAPILLQVVLVTQRPWLSTDVLSYIAQGFVGIGTGVGNAYTNVPRDVLGTVVGDQLTAIGWRPQTILSPYGPLWTAFEIGAMSVTRDIGVAVVLMKLPVLVASLGSAALIWRILGLVRPRLRLVGTVAFLWSPVVITELAGEGHIDGLMTFFVLLGLYATLRARPTSAALSGTLAAVTKYMPVILAPAQLVYIWRTSDRPDIGRRLVIAGLLALGFLVVLFAPFWVGLRTLEGLRVMGQPGPWPTVTGFLFRYFERAHPGIDGGTVAAMLVTVGFALYLLRQAFGVRDARRLLAASARTALAFVLVASPVFYPWYAVLPIALVALVPEASYLVVILALTVTSRIVAPLVDLRPAYEPIPGAAYSLTSIGLFACIAVAIALGVRAVWAWASAEVEESPATVF